MIFIACIETLFSETYQHIVVLKKLKLQTT